MNYNKIEIKSKNGKTQILIDGKDISDGVTDVTINIHGTEKPVMIVKKVIDLEEINIEYKDV